MLMLMVLRLHWLHWLLRVWLLQTSRHRRLLELTDDVQQQHRGEPNDEEIVSRVRRNRDYILCVVLRRVAIWRCGRRERLSVRFGSVRRRRVHIHRSVAIVRSMQFEKLSEFVNSTKAVGFTDKFSCSASSANKAQFGIVAKFYGQTIDNDRLSSRRRRHAAKSHLLET